MTDQVPSKDLVSWLRHQARDINDYDDEPSWSKGMEDAAEALEHLRRENVRWENAHKILLAENSRLLAELRAAHEDRVRLTGYLRSLGWEPTDHDSIRTIEDPSAYYGALNRLAVAMGNPALQWKDPETLESALIDEAVRRLGKPAHEREPPHCSNCSCSLPRCHCGRHEWTEGTAKIEDILGFHYRDKPCTGLAAEPESVPLTWETFWQKVRENDWTPSPDDLRKILNGTVINGADTSAPVCVTPEHGGRIMTLAECFAAEGGMSFTHWSKDPLIPYEGCNCSSCDDARTLVRTDVSDGTAQPPGDGQQ